eukprot:TRINITY_DN8582_c0_g1_i1.p3 TRINITY_DN8582_c0_g1~~TRINITY_DN8582_c0_g1_i1.p3  ORF type:complete len:143 (-),score=4.84 TRINITY_DN8582_c0_g1_i1:61-489(-)
MYVVANDRSEKSLLGHLAKNVLTVDTNPTCVITNGWKAYSTKHLAELGYQHVVVKHTEGFKVEEHTTNHIEGIWAEIKPFIKKGINETTYEEAQTWIHYAYWSGGLRKRIVSKVYASYLLPSDNVCSAVFKCDNSLFRYSFY